MKRILLIAALSALMGCANEIRDFHREPAMSPVGSGLQADTALPGQVVTAPKPRNGSLWDDHSASLFHDPRASRPGDIFTINISINDKATFDNASTRSRDAKATSSWGLNFPAAIAGSTDLESKSSTNGQGSVDRAEKIQLAVAAVVTDVLPNGNLVVSGSQEVRVNFEMRVLNVSGIVRPNDIGKDNTIAYDKIAEARISYGGRGRITEVQQPSVGQQLYDIVWPF